MVDDESSVCVQQVSAEELNPRLYRSLTRTGDLPSASHSSPADTGTGTGLVTGQCDRQREASRPARFDRVSPGGEDEASQERTGRPEGGRVANRTRSHASPGLLGLCVGAFGGQNGKPQVRTFRLFQGSNSFTYPLPMGLG